MDQTIPESVREFYDLVESGRFNQASQYLNADEKRYREIMEWEKGDEGTRYIEENLDKWVFHRDFYRTLLESLLGWKRADSSTV
jgi:hypothetical protein